MITITFVRLWYDLLEPNLVLNADMDEEVFREKTKIFLSVYKLQRLPSNLASLLHDIFFYFLWLVALSCHAACCPSNWLFYNLYFYRMRNLNENKRTISDRKVKAL